MVRLVFRPYTQLRGSICTSESKRASTRVSPGFALARHSSPSFGSQRARSRCTQRAISRFDAPGLRPGRPPTEDDGPGIIRQPPRGGPSHSFRLRVSGESPTTRAQVRLLGPCFKTGRWELGRQTSQSRIGARGPDARQRRTRASGKGRAAADTPAPPARRPAGGPAPKSRREKEIGKPTAVGFFPAIPKKG